MKFDQFDFMNFLNANNNFFIDNEVFLTEDLLRFKLAEYVENVDKCRTKKSEVEVPYYTTKKQNKKQTPLKIISGSPLRYSNKCRADLYYSSSVEVIEFKYHRKTDYSFSCRPDKRGSLYNDFARLSQLLNVDKYVVYFYDKDMNNYYCNKRNLNLEKLPKIIDSDDIYNNINNKKICPISFLKNAFLSFIPKNISSTQIINEILNNKLKISYRFQEIFSGNAHGVKGGLYLKVYKQI